MNKVSTCTFGVSKRLLNVSLGRHKINCAKYIVRHFSEKGDEENETPWKTVINDASVHLIERNDNDTTTKKSGSRYGSREYVLLPKGLTLEELKLNPKLKIASLFAYRNIIFGAKEYLKIYMSENTFIFEDEKDLLLESCSPLLDVALSDCHANGEQPQALSSLTGLSKWVSKNINILETEKNGNSISTEKSTGIPRSKVLEGLLNPRSEKQSENTVTYEAVKAIATMTPRQGHKVVGIGTYRDGRHGWEELAKEYIQLNLAKEVELYRSRDGEVVQIEYLADKSDAYLKSCGGTMARLFFL